MTATLKHGRSLIWIAALAATGVGMYYWGRRSSADAPPPAVAAAAPAASAAQPATGAATRAPAAIPRYDAGTARPLPSVDTPLRLILPELQRRAATEPAAACRLAAEMEYCDGLRMRLAGAENNLDMFEHQLERMPQDTQQQREQRQRMAESYQSMTDRLLTQSEHCAQVPPISAEQRAAYWRRAALAGVPAAMRHYASGNAFRYQDTLDNLSGLSTYRNEAESIARAAAQRGDARMMASLAFAYSPQRDGMRRSFLGQAVQADPVESLALFLQLRDSLPAQDAAANAATPPAPVGPGPRGPRGFGRGDFNPRDMVDTQIRSLTRDLSPEQASQARERAADRAQNWSPPTMPAAQTGAPGAGTQSNVPAMFLMQGGYVPDAQRQDCEGAN
ncbi:hypothetical protein J5226_18630 [Lysobacter sp. K5869]|uniref:hypothetical protein n=1 Tax=Lysobacter sp. K5869 TaxID=2820808 RepID=UPI001C0600BF|nr:hypothetical protein [Lysobacter sp. K5869]QWP75610.1 hypothetical protein J5226_18630 [Lysobacter sp. K5869]